MPKPSFFRISLIAIICLSALLFASPNFFYNTVDKKLNDPSRQSSWPNFMPSTLVKLGLDLRGGVYMLLEVKTDEVIREKFDFLWTEIRGSLIKKRKELGAKKTRQAKTIKQTLQLVEAYTATHLDSNLDDVAKDPDAHKLERDETTEFLQAATSDEARKLANTQTISLTLIQSDLIDELRGLLSRAPPTSSTIQYLVQHAEVAAWIREGLPLHKGKEKCEFCCNALESSRLKALQAHFSKDMETLEKALIQRKGELRGMKLDSSSFSSNEFYPKIWSCLERDQSDLNKLVAPYNDCLDKIIAAIDSKLSDLFQRVLCPKLGTGLLEKIQAAADSINKRIKASNQMTDEFGVRKKEAITKLKRHFAAEFFNAEKLGSDKALTSICQKHLSRYKKIQQKLSADSEKLHAKISKAQKGRKKEISYLASFWLIRTFQFLL